MKAPSTNFAFRLHHGLAAHHNVVAHGDTLVILLTSTFFRSARGKKSETSYNGQAIADTRKHCTHVAYHIRESIRIDTTFC